MTHETQEALFETALDKDASVESLFERQEVRGRRNLSVGFMRNFNDWEIYGWLHSSIF